MLSKKHYKAIAKIINNSQVKSKNVYKYIVNTRLKVLAKELADYFEHDNPAKTPKNCTCGTSYLQDKENKIVCTNCGSETFKFDRQQFMKACGLE